MRQVEHLHIHVVVRRASVLIRAVHQNASRVDDLEGELVGVEHLMQCRFKCLALQVDRIGPGELRGDLRLLHKRHVDARVEPDRRQDFAYRRVGEAQVDGRTRIGEYGHLRHLPRLIAQRIHAGGRTHGFDLFAQPTFDRDGFGGGKHVGGVEVGGQAVLRRRRSPLLLRLKLAGSGHMFGRGRGGGALQRDAHVNAPGFIGQRRAVIRHGRVPVPTLGGLLPLSHRATGRTPAHNGQGQHQGRTSLHSRSHHRGSF